MITYPRLLRRVQATLIDSIIMPAVFILVMLLISQFDIENIYVKAAALILPIFILDPILVSFTGGTIGHHLLKIRIRRSNEEKKLNILLATLRFLTKVLLGWLSFIFILTTKKHQAIHDMFSNSIVVNAKSEGLSDVEALTERYLEKGDYKYPSILLRIFVILLYNVILFILSSVFISMMLSTSCFENNICTRTDNFIDMVFSIILLLGFVLTIIYGFNSRLYGCRKKKVLAKQG